MVIYIPRAACGAAQGYGDQFFRYTEPITIAGLIFLAASYPHLPPDPTTGEETCLRTPATAGASGTPHIEFRDVVKRFGDHTVLDDLNFTVSKG